MKRKFILCSFVIALFLISGGFAQKRVVTNDDLEKYRQERLNAEAEYNKQVERGARPSRAELARRDEERLKFYREFTEQAAAKQRQTESVFQNQAFAIKSEIAALEAEINYVRQRVNEIPEPQTYYSVGYLPYGAVGYGGFGGIGFGGVGFPQFPNGANINGASGNFKFGNRAGVHVSINNGYNQNFNNRNGVFGVSANNRQAPQVNLNGNGGFAQTNRLGTETNLSFGGAPYTAGLLSAPFTLPTPQNLTREELLQRLRALEQARAGLYARFSVLEDEARRNGVRID